MDRLIEERAPPVPRAYYVIVVASLVHLGKKL